MNNTSNVFKENMNVNTKIINYSLYKNNFDKSNLTDGTKENNPIIHINTPKEYIQLIKNKESEDHD